MGYKIALLFHDVQRYPTIGTHPNANYISCYTKVTSNTILVQYPQQFANTHPIITFIMRFKALTLKLIYQKTELIETRRELG